MAKARAITGLYCRAPVGENARIIGRVRLDELYEWGKYVDTPYSIHELHNLRIAAKRLRYTLEIFVDVLPAACAPVIRELEQIQEELGALHDSDMMIALLRLCLGSEDSGMAYERALARADHGRGQFVLPPVLVVDVVDTTVAPTAEERYGLERLLSRREREREEQHKAFRRHWQQLQARDFRAEILELLDT